MAAGENDLDRNNLQHRNSTFTAGEQLNITSGRDATISGANLLAKDLNLNIGNNLHTASRQDTGTAEGKRWDAGGSMTVGIGVSGGANVGYGETEGSRAWVKEQTTLIGLNSVNINVGNHTQVDGAMIANIKQDGTDGGNLSINTRTLGFGDLKDHDKENSNYANLGFSTGGNPAANANTGASQDEEGSSWNLQGSHYELDREQTTRATIGLGNITVREDQQTGADSTSGLNRDITTAQEITKDKEREVDVYVSSTAIDSAKNFTATGDENTLNRWVDDGKNLARDMTLTYENMGALADDALVASGEIPEFVRQTTDLINGMADTLGVITLGVAPGVKNNGGLLGGAAAITVGDQFFYRVQVDTAYNPETGNFELIDYTNLGEVDGPEKDNYVFTNGIQNSLENSIRNGAMQTGSYEFIVAYNPQHGLLGDLVESAWDKNIGGIVSTGNARQIRDFYQTGIENNISFNIAGHSQGTLMNYRAMDGLDFTNGGKIEVGTVQFSGSPVEAERFYALTRETGFALMDPDTKTFDYSKVIFQINRPAGEVSLFGTALVDSVADIPVVLGGNYGQGEGGSLGASILSLPFLFSEVSPHSNYLCQPPACNKDLLPTVEIFRSNLRTPETNGRGYTEPRKIIISPSLLKKSENDEGNN